MYLRRRRPGRCREEETHTHQAKKDLRDQFRHRPTFDFVFHANRHLDTASNEQFHENFPHWQFHCPAEGPMKAAVPIEESGRRK